MLGARDRRLGSGQYQSQRAAAGGKGGRAHDDLDRRASGVHERGRKVRRVPALGQRVELVPQIRSRGRGEEARSSDAQQGVAFHLIGALSELADKRINGASMAIAM